MGECNSGGGIKMNSKFKSYLAKLSPVVIEPIMIDELRDEMKRVVPEIVKAIREREKLAVELWRKGGLLYCYDG